MVSIRTLLRAGVFFGFFTAFFMVYFLKKRYGARRVFLGFFLICLIVPGVTGLSVWPFYSWHLFEQTAPEETTYYEVRIVDEQGEELIYDARAIPPMVGPINYRYAENMAGVGINEYTDEEKQAFMCFQLRQANEYRAQREAGNFTRRSYVPRHSIDYRWTDSQVDSHERFDKIRIYQVNLTVSTDGSTSEGTNETVIYSTLSAEC